MAVNVTYPGVYVQEVPSGVRTIMGVSTSIAMFMGRTKQGPMNKPVLCLNYSDFERTFSSRQAGCELPRAVRLFFQNGGTRCYVMRIARGAGTASVTLKNEAKQAVVKLTAKSPGLVGDTIRLAVTYNKSDPENSFNLQLFRWEKNSRGVMVRQDQEQWLNLYMDPSHPRYLESYLKQNSTLVEAKDLKTAAPVAGFSQSGRAVPSRTDTIFRTNWMALLGKAAATNNFRISVNRGAFTDVSLSAIDFANDAQLSTAAKTRANLATVIQNELNSVLGTGSQVTVSFQAGPTGKTGQDNETTTFLRIASTQGDVKIQPASASDLAVALMLGTAQGGSEKGLYAFRRPAPNGIVFNPGTDLVNLKGFAAQKQTAFDKITLGGKDIPLNNAMKTTTPSTANPEPRMFDDGYTVSATGNSDGVREKMAKLAAAINQKAAADPAFSWKAELWGVRLAILPLSGGDNSTASITSSQGDGVNIGGGTSNYFHANVRYYSLGPSGLGDFQTAAPAAASDGSAPGLTEFRNGFKVIDSEVDLFNLMILPDDQGHTPAVRASLWGPAGIFCRKRRAFLLMDPPAAWKTAQDAVDLTKGVNSLRVGLVKDHSALFFPRITIMEQGVKVQVGPCGAVAGLMARIDASRGVWKAAAGTEADLRGVVGVEYKFSDEENGVMNPKGVNTIRVFPNGIVNWGARTMDGDDDFSSEYKYVPVRRLALFMEESLYRGLKWVVFEPNDEPLWSQIRLNVGAFMHNLFRQGAFQGATPKEAYFVKCDKETTTQNDINAGVVKLWVGFAPLKPAEFVILYLQQMAGQLEV